MEQYYIIDPKTYDDQFWWKKDDIEFWKNILLHPQKKVLELAAGTGRLAKPLLREKSMYKGLELSHEYVDFANSKFPTEEGEKDICYHTYQVEVEPCLGFILHKLGATTALICCNQVIDRKNIMHLLFVNVGPEVITGSTRMKAGTATKMILNMISTTVMVKLNKVFGNLMIDLKLNNRKLLKRAISIILEITKTTDRDNAEIVLKEANGNIKIAVVMIIYGIDYYQAEKKMRDYNGNLKLLLKNK